MGGPGTDPCERELEAGLQERFLVSRTTLVFLLTAGCTLGRGNENGVADAL